MKYLASSFLVLTIFVLGMTILNNYDKMKQIEEAMSRLTVEQEGAENTALTQAVSADAAEKQEETRKWKKRTKRGRRSTGSGSPEEWRRRGRKSRKQSRRQKARLRLKRT